MPRKNLTDVVKKAPNIELDELSKIVSSYIVNKDMEKTYKEQANADNTRIKSAMEILNITECKSEDGRMIAKVSEQKKESFREEELIGFLKKNNISDDIVKTKEYIDYDELEDALYNNRIPSELVKSMNDYKDVTITKVLRVSKVKGE